VETLCPEWVRGDCSGNEPTEWLWSLHASGPQLEGTCNVQHLEVGLVGADDALVDFYAAVFEMEKLPAMQAGPGVVHRLQGPGVVIKVMVPSEAPTPAQPVEPFFAMTGLRYVTIYDADLDAVVERAVARGGSVRHGPTELGPGVRIVVLSDPDRNVIEVVEVNRPPS